MNLRHQLRKQVLNVSNEAFEAVALAIFRYQAVENPVYARYLKYLKIKPNEVIKITEVPFMPIGFFKNHRIVSNAAQPQIVFESSGTTTSSTSHHFVADPDLYERISTQIFEANYGSLQNVSIYALLPSYLERNNSSLVYMIDKFIGKTNQKSAGFYLNNTDELIKNLKNSSDNETVILWGVAYALLDLAENYELSFLQSIPNLILMETGGMKGRRREMLREELHQTLTEVFGVQTVHSEYGMTELLSQAYSKGSGVFEESATMRILLRDVNDPFAVYDATDAPRYGGINVIDLANIDSCAFIETQDLGRFAGKNTFEVIGRFDNSDIRGCNLLVS